MAFASKVIDDSRVSNKGMAKVYRNLMKQMGADIVDVLDSDLDADQLVYRLRPDAPEVSGELKALRDSWFNADGTMKQTNHFATDAGQGTNPRTSKLSAGEKWMRDRQFTQDHFYGRNAPGGRAVDTALNRGRGPKIPDSAIGAANDAKGLVGAMDVARGADPSLAGTIDIGNKGLHSNIVSEIDALLDAGIIDKQLHSEALQSIGGRTPTFAKHPLLSTTADELSDLGGRQLDDAALAAKGAVTDIRGNPYKGSRRGMATLLGEAGMLDADAAARMGGRGPTRTALKGGGTRAIKTGLKYGPKGMGLNAASMLGKTLRVGGPMALYALPEVMANVIAPTANQTGRKKAEEFGSMLNTDNWFDGRKGVNESILRFGGSMLLDPLYTYGGIALEDLARNRARGSRESRRRTQTGMRGRFGNQGKGLISSP